MNTIPAWLRVEERPSDTGKTKILALYNVKNAVFLGEVRWWGAWRKYCFFPAGDTLYDPSCLNEIANVLVALMDERKV